ncbi:MAG: DUF2975 domain-containing protein [Hyphomonadaceae bacterium]
MAADETPALKPPSVRVVWFARIMEWLCWLGIAGVAVIGVLATFQAFPEGWVVRESNESALVNATIAVNDPAHPNATAELQQDLVYRLALLLGIGLFVWALWSARRIFAGIGRGEYFAKGTILGVRNFALAVLLYMTVGPVVRTLASALYMARFEHGMFTLQFALSGTLMLMLIFSGAVALVSTVMAHAAEIDEENRQFV